MPRYNLRQLLEPATMGDPMRPLLWVSKSHAKLAAALSRWGTRSRKSSIPKLLGVLEYRRQVNRKTLEGSRNPDRDAQFEHINAAVIAMQAAGQPVISIDTKKKELVGDYKNGGSDYRPEGCPDKVNVHDFVDKELGKVGPLRRLRHRRQRRLRECRHRQRYRAVRGQFDPALAAMSWAASAIPAWTD